MIKFKIFQLVPVKKSPSSSYVSAKYQGVPNTFAPTPATGVKVVSILL